ncbi:hypothetical protein HK105_200232 [Polyrhizophydium stewartii]|uniref:Uncharacterized protein n=1 Tax=Polyrhizophydium stewartii TaxID=2732419 RepID=A0ABR4NKX1_9FUNG
MLAKILVVAAAVALRAASQPVGGVPPQANTPCSELGQQTCLPLDDGQPSAVFATTLLALATLALNIASAPLNGDVLLDDVPCAEGHQRCLADSATHGFATCQVTPANTTVWVEFDCGEDTHCQPMPASPDWVNCVGN